MIKVITSKIKRHQGVFFLKDIEKNQFIGKIYDIEGKKKLRKLLLTHITI